MLKGLFAAAAAVSMIVLAPVTAIAGETEAAEAKARIVFYRAEEMSRTRNINFEALAAGKPLGRVQYRRAVVSEVPAGEITLRTTLPESDALSIDVKPGQTYYVYTKLERKGQAFVNQLELVEEQVARSQNPALDSVI